MQLFHRFNPSDHSSLLLLSFFSMLISCSGSGKKIKKSFQPISAEKLHEAENALLGLDIFEGLEVKVMATEPMLRNPTNIDVDEKGQGLGNRSI